MTEQTEYQYDVFISYSHTDKEWVHGWLLPRLETADLQVCIDFRDFDVGVPSLVLQRDFVILRSEAMKNLILQWRIASLERDSSLPSVAQNDIIGKVTL
ncbi:MAG: hypothetical protein E3J21_04170 [Anaerolineales bacterium]|nr:MAG: hypothetical protein E3J21_04170 [Anaerolineales bacterium]